MNRTKQLFIYAQLGWWEKIPAVEYRRFGSHVTTPAVVDEIACRSMDRMSGARLAKKLKPGGVA